MILRQYARLFGSRDESGARRLGTASPLEAAQHGKARLQVLLTPRSTYGPVMQENLSGSHCVGDEISSSAVFASVNRYARFPVIASHAQQRQGAGGVA